MSTAISIRGAQAVRDIKYPETRTLRWTAGRRRGEYEKVKNLNRATCFSSIYTTTQIQVVWPQFPEKPFGLWSPYPSSLQHKKTALNLKENKHMKCRVYSDDVCSMSEHHSFETNVFTCKLSYFYMRSVLCLVQGSNPDKTTSLLKLTVHLICTTTPRKISNMTKVKMNETLKYHLVCDLLCLSYAR